MVNSKLKGAFSIVISLLIVMSGILFWSQKLTLNERIAILPKVGEGVALSFKTIEEMNERKVDLTYVVESKEQVRFNKAPYKVTIKATNYMQSQLMNYPMLTGAFFNEVAQSQERKVMVLNEKAAHTIFGSTAIVGNDLIYQEEVYRILGVIKDDEEKELNVYLPITLSKGQPDSFVARLNSKSGLTKEVVINLFKQQGITKDNYEFISMANLSKSLVGRILVGGYLLSVTVLLMFCFTYGKRTRGKVQHIQEEMKQYYFMDYIMKHKKKALGLLKGLSLIGGLLAGITFIVFRIMTFLISWSMEDFLPQLQRGLPLVSRMEQIRNFYLCLNGFLILVLFVLIYIAVITVKKQE